jgi:thiol:disulfide interchange protein DsbD
LSGSYQSFTTILPDFMKLTGIVLALFCLSTPLLSQNPVSWSFDQTKVSDTEYDLLFKADIAKTWVIYSQYLESTDGPIPTSFSFEKNADIVLVGSTAELGHLKEEYDELFGMTVKKLDGQVTFKQRVRTLRPGVPVTGYLTFMTCDNERCLPPRDVEFSFELK